MSLRKSPQPSSQRLAANRTNAKHSTGPRSQQAKQKTRLNALQHGLYAENDPAVLTALGEDPNEYDALKRDLLTSYGPGDSLWYHQVEDLAKLYWRRRRLERAQGIFIRRALLDIERRERWRRAALVAATYEVTEHDIPDIQPPPSGDTLIRLRKLLSSLEIMQYQIPRGTFRPRYYAAVEMLSGGKLQTRARRIVHLLRLFADPVYIRDREETDEEYKAILEKDFGPMEAAGEEQRAELLKLIGEEMEVVKREMVWAEEIHAEEVEVERASLLIPMGEGWEVLLRQQEKLDRAIDRKVKLLLQMRKEWAREERKAEPAPEPDPSTEPEWDELQEEATTEAEEQRDDVTPAQNGVAPAEARAHADGFPLSRE